MIRVGYQGIVGSYSHQASIELIKELNLKDTKLVPLISSVKVVEYLLNGKIDYGVLAITNSTAGEVYETKIALKNTNLKRLFTKDILIVHCLFSKNKTNINELKRVVSHEQALAQTKETRKKYFNNLEEVAYEDTAKAAKDLKNGYLLDTDAVICSRHAGTHYGLKLIQEKINDKTNNYTTFGIYSK